MKGLTMENQKDTAERFDYVTYAKYCKINPVEAKRYIESFNKPAVVSVEEITTGSQEIKVEQSSTEEEKPSNPEQEVIKKAVITDEDVKQLRKVYEERAGKKCFAGWNGKQIIEKINSL